MAKSMGKMGYMQGDMNPHVEDYQRPSSAYSQQDFNKTTEYISRNDATQTAQASDIKKQDYKGRYS